MSCCCGDGGELRCCNPPCESYPRTYALDIEGIVNNNCVFCSEYNGSFLLHYSSFGTGQGNCAWRDHRTTAAQCGIAEDLTCQELTGRPLWTWELGRASPNMMLRPNVTPGPTYTRPSDQWNCDPLASNVLTLATVENSRCQGWPALLTVRAQGAIHDGCTCFACEASPLQWTVAITGVVDRDCLDPPSCAAAYNTTHTLTRQSPCMWTAGPFPLCGFGFGGGVTLKLNHECNYAELLLSDMASGLYRTPLSTFNCLGSNTLTQVPGFLSPGDASCTATIGSLTINPV